LPWWQERKELSLAREAKVARGQACAKPGDALLIVTEGTVTEPVYFHLLRSELKLSAVSVVVRPGDHSHPPHVIESAARLVKDHARRARKGLLGMNEPAKFDQVWAVIDTDVAVRNGIWNEVEQLAATRKVNLAHSTPCFEFWLLLHLVDFTTRQDLLNGDAAVAAVKKALGRDYAKDAEVTVKVMPTILKGWPEAVKSAQQVRKHHLDAGNRIPANPSTEVDRLVCAMNDSAPPRTGLVAKR
jgi:hypothetical protein